MNVVLCVGHACGWNPSYHMFAAVAVWRCITNMLCWLLTCLLYLGPQCRPPDEGMKTSPCPWETEAEDQAGRVQDHTVGCLPGQGKMIKFFTMSMHGWIYIWWEETSEINRTQTCCCNHAKLQELTHAASFVKPRLLSSVLSGSYCHLITYLPNVTLWHLFTWWSSPSLGYLHDHEDLEGDQSACVGSIYTLVQEIKLSCWRIPFSFFFTQGFRIFHFIYIYFLFHFVVVFLYICEGFCLFFFSCLFSVSFVAVFVCLFFFVFFKFHVYILFVFILVVFLFYAGGVCIDWL